MARSNPPVVVWLMVLCSSLTTAPFDTAQPSAAAPLAAGAEPARKTRAPVPKTKPRAEVIVIVSGYGTPGRLFDTDGNCLGDLPFDSVFDCVLSPGGTQMAVVVREREPVVPNLRAGRSTYAVYVERIGTDRKAVGAPLAVGLKQPTLAWAGAGTLYVTEHDAPPPGGTCFRPAGVSVYDVAKRIVTADQRLQPYCVFDVSADGRRLLARHVILEPAERMETVVLDAETRKPVDVGASGVTWTRFFGTDRLVGTRAKPNGAANETEHVVFDLRTKKVAPVGIPWEIARESNRVFEVLPSPDGKRLLYCWTEEVPAPADWPAGVPCQVARLTAAEPDGRFPKVVFRPRIKERQDEILNHVYKVDWK